jgi:hypothetical protein
VLSTHEHLDGQLVEEQSTSEADTAAKVVAKNTFMIQ